jgi:hypothetical protein
MRAECLLEVAAAIGRTPTKREADLLEGGLLATMRELARTDANWRQLSGDQRLQLAAQVAKTQAIAAADAQAARRAGNLVAQVREAQRLDARARALGGAQAHHDALFERMRTVDDYVAGVRNETMSQMIDAIEAVEPGFLGLFDDAGKIRDFVRAVRGEGTPEPHMKRAAQAYNDTMEALRVRANGAGADIGKLDYAYLPQPHDVGRIARAGADQWANDVLPLLDRTRYLTADGAAMDDAAVTRLLRDAWTTLATEGRNKLTPGQARGGSRAARFDDAHRAIHFKDADSHLAYLKSYGRGSMLEAIHGHVGMMSKTIGMLEELGANPNATYRLLKDLAEQKDNLTGRRSFGATLDMVWDTLNGTTSQPVSAKLAQVFQGIRNFTTAAKLGSVMLSAITDAPLQVIVAKSSGVPLGRAMTSIFSGVGAEKQAIARSIGIGLDEVAGEMARWHSDNLAQGWTKKLANTTMKLTLVDQWSHALRRGFGLTLSETLHRMKATDWAGLGEGDLRRLTSAGVTEGDWRLWQMAKPFELNGAQLLTKDGLRALTKPELEAAGFKGADVDRAVARLLGYIDQEAHTAVLTPDLMTRATLQQGTRAGTIGGEVLRSMMLFKSFSLAIVQKHLQRIRNIPTTQGKLAYSVAMMTTLPMIGAVSLQLKDISSGKDPRDMTTGKFWLAAAAQGGGLGVFGDILYTGMGGNARGGQANWTNLAGPVFGTAIDAVDLTLGNIPNAAQGKDTHFLAEGLRFVKGNTPLLNLWYLRAAIDHLALHELQEKVSPGYLRKIRERSRRDWGQDYWWRPGDALPDRAPDVTAAAGE